MKTDNQITSMSTQFTVTFVNQPSTSSQAALVPIIGQSIVAAGTWLNSFVKGTGVIDVRVNFDAVIPTMSGASLARLPRIKETPLIAELGDLLTRFGSITMCCVATGVIWVVIKSKSLIQFVLNDYLHLSLWVGGL